MPPIERPPVRTDDVEPVEPLKDLVARRRARADRMVREMALQLAADMSASHVVIPGDSGDERGGD